MPALSPGTRRFYNPAVPGENWLVNSQKPPSIVTEKIIEFPQSPRHSVTKAYALLQLQRQHEDMLYKLVAFEEQHKEQMKKIHHECEQLKNEMDRLGMSMSSDGNEDDDFIGQNDKRKQTDDWVQTVSATHSPNSRTHPDTYPTHSAGYPFQSRTHPTHHPNLALHHTTNHPTGPPYHPPKSNQPLYHQELKQPILNNHPMVESRSHVSEPVYAAIQSFPQNPSGQTQGPTYFLFGNPELLTQGKYHYHNPPPRVETQQEYKARMEHNAHFLPLYPTDIEEPKETYADKVASRSKSNAFILRQPTKGLPTPPVLSAQTYPPQPSQPSYPTQPTYPPQPSYQAQPFYQPQPSYPPQPINHPSYQTNQNHPVFSKLQHQPNHS